jgi:hypothetical protein
VVNVEIDLRETGWNGMERTDLFQDGTQWRAPENIVINLAVS